MATATIKYLGNLKTECKHAKSGDTFITDAPVDNNGKGEAFSPTDLLAVSYVSCMITVIGIYCEKNGLEFLHGVGDVKKEMLAAPRRIGKMVIDMDLTGNTWTTEQQAAIIKVAEECPVAFSVAEEMEVTISYKF